MSDVRWASLALVVGLGAAVIPGCSDSTTNCMTDRPDGSAPPDMRPRTDAALTEAAAPPIGGAGRLGATCTATTDCTGGLTCFRPTDDLRPGDGPPNGLCTRECTNDVMNTGCAPLGGTCLQFSDAPVKAYCIENCQAGPTAAPKCHGRGDTACETLFDANGAPVLNACISVCTDDADCGTRKCDFSSGLCSTQPSAGLPYGSPCTVSTQCLGGLCVNGAGEGEPPLLFCTGTCRFGGLEGCGYVRTGPASTSGAACAVPLELMPGDGDEGYCIELCDTDADCGLKAPGWGCDTTPVIIAKWNHGLCLPRDLPAADAGRDAASSVDAGREAAVDARAVVTPEASADPGVDAAVDGGTD